MRETDETEQRLSGRGQGSEGTGEPWKVFGDSSNKSRHEVPTGNCVWGRGSSGGPKAQVCGGRAGMQAGGLRRTLAPR